MLMQDFNLQDLLLHSPERSNKAFSKTLYGKLVTVSYRRGIQRERGISPSELNANSLRA